MSKRARIVTFCVLSLLFWGIVWPIISIMLNVRAGQKIKESLLSTLQEKYPDRAFHGGVGKGSTPEEGPGVGINISGKSDPQFRKELLGFVAEEIESHQYRASFLLDFEFENKRFVFYKSKKIGSEWEEQKAWQ